MIILQALLFLLVPYLLLYFHDKKVIAILSPVVWAYTVGIVWANLPFIDNQMIVSKSLTDISVPLAIPLLMIGVDIKSWLKMARSTVISFVLILISVVLITFVSSYIFADRIPDYWKIGAMLTGVYTGGTPNMTAIGMALGVEEEIFVLVNGADLILGASYLLFIMTIGVRMMGNFLKILPVDNDNDETCVESIKAKPINLFYFLSLSLFLLGGAFGLSTLIFSEVSVAFIILVITTGGIICSFKEKIREAWGSYQLGQYFLLVFCVSIGSLAEIDKLMNTSPIYLAAFSFVMLCSILMHLVLCKMFKIDRDTAIITSIAAIFGPPFVAPVSDVLKNRKILVSGITSGLVGYAVGNYLGLGVSYLLK